MGNAKSRQTSRIVLIIIIIIVNTSIEIDGKGTLIKNIIKRVKTIEKWHWGESALTESIKFTPTHSEILAINNNFFRAATMSTLGAETLHTNFFFETADLTASILPGDKYDHSQAQFE